MGTGSTSVYEQVMEKTRGLTARSGGLVVNLRGYMNVSGGRRAGKRRRWRRSIIIVRFITREICQSKPTSFIQK
jgi:hypothetical protein